MPKAAKPGPKTVPGHRKPAPEAAFDAREASEATGRQLRDPRAPNAQPGEGLQSATPQALGPSGPKRRSSADPGNGAEASDRDESGSDPARRPSAAPLEFAGAAAAGTSAKLGHIASFSRAAQASGPQHAKAPEAQRDQVAAPSALALDTPVGADGSPDPADGDAQSDPKRGPHRGVQRWREGPKAGSRGA